MKLRTVHSHVLNAINELKEWFQKFRNRKNCKMHKLNINHAQPLLPLFYFTLFYLSNYIELYLILFNFIYGSLFTLWPFY